MLLAAESTRDCFIVGLILLFVIGLMVAAGFCVHIDKDSEVEEEEEEDGDREEPLELWPGFS